YVGWWAERLLLRGPLHVGERRPVSLAARPPPGRDGVVGRTTPRRLPRPAQRRGVRGTARPPRPDGPQRLSPDLARRPRRRGRVSGHLPRPRRPRRCHSPAGPPRRRPPPPP